MSIKTDLCNHVETFVFVIIYLQIKGKTHKSFSFFCISTFLRRFSLFFDKNAFCFDYGQNIDFPTNSIIDPTKHLFYFEFFFFRNANDLPCY